VGRSAAMDLETGHKEGSQNQHPSSLAVVSLPAETRSRGLEGTQKTPQEDEGSCEELVSQNLLPQWGVGCKMVVFFLFFLVLRFIYLFIYLESGEAPNKDFFYCGKIHLTSTVLTLVSVQFYCCHFYAQTILDMASGTPAW